MDLDSGDAGCKWDFGGKFARHVVNPPSYVIC
jgi:hypothetical protein